MLVEKAHAYGNDFLYVREETLAAGGHEPAALAKRLCDRHTGIGADGLIIYRPTTTGAAMRLVNADGSPAEVSGNGVRALAALLARRHRIAPGPDSVIRIDTAAGPKHLTLLDAEQDSRYLFCAEMGTPERLARTTLTVNGLSIDAVVLSMGNPQCVVLGPLDAERLRHLGSALQHHDAFPDGVNLELAEVVARDRVRILIWERGVGPTHSSGTGSCAAAVAAAAYGGAFRSVAVEAPGGTQHVEWSDSGVRLTGWAEVLLEGQWIPK